MDFSFKMNSKEYHPLKLDEVHIWSACLSENENNMPYFASLLSHDEQKVVSCFRFSRDQKRFTLCRGILRSLLAGYIGEPPEKIEILYGLWGKPCLPKEKVLFFNLSHSRDYALYAVTQSYEVGIDLEYRDKAFEVEDMAQNIFSRGELSHWNALNPEEKTKFFFEYWVSKEAFLKASGKGWLESKQEHAQTSINSLKQEQKNDLLEDGEIIYHYFFESIPGYASALYVEGPPLTILHYVWGKDFPYASINSDRRK